MITHRSAYEVIMPFGKHKNKSLGYINDVDKGYLDWISGNESMPMKWRELAAMTLLGEDLSTKWKIIQSTSTRAEVKYIGDNTLQVRFEYNEELLQRFKLQIDGRKWNDEDKCWEIPSVQIVKLVELFGGTANLDGDDYTKKVYREEKKRRQDLDEIRSKYDTDLNAETKLPLYGYQRVAVEFVERAGGRAMIADEMGLGKTPTAIGFALRQKYKTLVVCPKSTVPGWMREVQRFAGRNAVCWASEGRLGRSDAQFQIINYDIVEKHLKELNKMNFDLLVCDEATYLKNRRTKRAKATLGSWKERKKYPGIKAKSCLFLTGTPVLNRPVEAYHLLNYLDKNRFNNFYNFVNLYGGWRGSEPQNLDDLHKRTQDLVIRRTKKEVLPDLPDKQRNDLYVEMEAQDMKEYNQHLNDLFRRWRQLGKPTVAEMPGIQRFLIKKKMPRAIEMIDEMLENDRGILVYSVYIEPLKYLKKHYGDKAALVIGEMNSTERQKNIDSLKDGKSQVGLFSIGAGAMGIDGIQHAIDTVLFLDMWWTPAVHQQAEDRVHRIGQANKVQIFYFICENTMDEYMRQLLDEKIKVIEQVVDGRILTKFNPNKSFFKEFVFRLRTNYIRDMHDIDVEKTVEV